MYLTIPFQALWRNDFLKGTNLKRLWNEKVIGKKYGQVGFTDYDQQLAAIKVKLIISWILI